MGCYTHYYTLLYFIVFQSKFRLVFSLEIAILRVNTHLLHLQHHLIQVSLFIHFFFPKSPIPFHSTFVAHSLDVFCVHHLIIIIFPLACLIR
jgi:hypothetical protein